MNQIVKECIYRAYGDLRVAKHLFNDLSPK